MRNVVIRRVAQLLAATGQVTLVALGNIIGTALAPGTRPATLPVSRAVLGVAAAQASEG